MLAYAKALQFWAEKAQLAWASKPCQLAAWMKELRESMELLMLFTDEEVLAKELSLHWVVTSSWPFEPVEPNTMWEQSCSRCRRACTQGSFPVTCSIGHSKLTITPMANASTVSSQMTGTLTISNQWVKTPLGSPITQKLMPPPSYAEIARSMRGDNSPHITINVPHELTMAQGFLVGTAATMVISTQMQQDAVTGITYLDTVMASMSLVSLGSTPMTVDCVMPDLEDIMDSD